MADIGTKCGGGGGGMPYPGATYPNDQQLSENIPGMGSFWLRPDSVHPRVRFNFLEMEASAKEELVNHAYQISQAVCDMFCPGDKMELMDAVVDSHKTYRRKFERKTGVARSIAGAGKRKRPSGDMIHGLPRPDALRSTGSSGSSMGTVSRDSLDRSRRGLESPSVEYHLHTPPMPRPDHHLYPPYAPLHHRSEQEGTLPLPMPGKFPPSPSPSSPFHAEGGSQSRNLGEGVALSGLMRLSGPDVQGKGFKSNPMMPVAGTSGEPHPTSIFSSMPIPHEAFILSRISHKSSGVASSSSCSSIGETGAKADGNNDIKEI